jgi:hypothetical protein
MEQDKVSRQLKYNNESAVDGLLDLRVKLWPITRDVNGHGHRK